MLCVCVGDVITVRCGGFLWLKSVAISLVSCRKAEVVECPGRKPCWSADCC